MAVATETCTATDASSRTLKRLAARAPVGTVAGPGVVLSKEGAKLRRIHGTSEEETLLLGGACSEVFSGPRLAKVLRPAFELQRKTLESLEKGEAITPLSIHTSAGVPEALSNFVEALAPHLPWSSAEDDWFINLQLEGATAVWAGVESLMRLRELGSRPGKRGLVTGNSADTPSFVGVANNSYHGAKTTGLGQPALPRWPGAPRAEGQLAYPVPPVEASHSETACAAYLVELDNFLDKHGDQIGVFLFEPQWGSSLVARAWPPQLLKEAIARCQRRGAFVLCDEIMCGLGRHGQGTLFLSKVLDLNPDAVTFGKSVATGTYPLSGVIVKSGASLLHGKGANVQQSHTYAGSSALAYLTAAEVIAELPRWFQHASNMGQVVQEVLGPLVDGKFLMLHGQGLMWGGEFISPEEDVRRKALEAMKQACKEERVWPYFVPRGGFMISPTLDIEEAQFRDGLHRLSRCLAKVKASVIG
eukprot:TRINITY_DN78122_c0_g1_i1.p1 TRINITY_DN78122_c0_g1~~TRINITY_DN78122_c0_g1_i1.p1  ORF type:complete len:482 (-),score=107.24 TRINITY_DN78122_c0_g1_i1:53-1474(-)